MDFNNKFTDDSWAENGTTAEPSENLRQSGFQGGYKPPANVFNWFWRTVMKAVTELQTKLSGVDSAVAGKADASALTAHTGNKSNPHSVTKAQVGLSNVDNTSDLNKPISTAVEEALDNKANEWVATTSGTNTAYTVTLDPAPTELYAGMTITIIPHTTSNSTAATLNVNGLGAKGFRIREYPGSNIVPESAYFLKEDAPVQIMYDGTYWIVYSREKQRIVNGSGINAIMMDSMNNEANGESSAALGIMSKALAVFSYAMGVAINSKQYGCVTLGIFNKNEEEIINDSLATNDSLIVGGGMNNANRFNSMRVNRDGTVYAGKAFNQTGADYAEYFEWADGNPEEEDRVGYFVTLSGEKIAFAGPEDDVLGIVSGSAGVVGDAYEDEWQGRFLTDAFGRRLREEIEIEAVTDEAGTVLEPAHRTEWFAVNPAWDEKRAYIPRSKRAEWDVVGLLGKLYVRDDGTAQAGGYVKPAAGGIATASEQPTRFRVMERTGEGVVRVFVRG